jgi:GNAT superfamily N-acetyltransferase
VRVDSLALQMRPRAPHEAADLGVRLCQSVAGSVFRCYLVVALPVVVIGFALYEVATWLPMLTLWFAKPWLDRTVLFVLSRAAFGQSTTVSDLWRGQRDVWWRQLILSWTWRRLSPWRSFTQPIYQLEGLGFFQMRERAQQLRRRHSGAAFVMTYAFMFAEIGIMLAFMLITLLFATPEGDVSFVRFFSEGTADFWKILVSVAYAVAVLFVEPFYVAAGFGMYLSRRAELEAWDIEQEFRRAFSR